MVNMKRVRARLMHTDNGFGPAEGEEVKKTTGKIAFPTQVDAFALPDRCKVAHGDRWRKFVSD